MIYVIILFVNATFWFTLGYCVSSSFARNRRGGYINRRNGR